MVNIPDGHVVEINLTEEEKESHKIFLTWIDKDLLKEEVGLKFFFNRRGDKDSITLRKTND